MSLLPVDEAIARILAGAVPVPAESVPLAAATGRTLAAPLAATRPQPPFAASAMDGYAVRAGEVAAPGAILTVAGIAAAGHAFAGRLAPGETVRIFTGAPVPPGTDAILIQENVEAVDEHTIRATAAVSPGQHIRPAGFDFAAGTVLLDEGRVFGMREVAAAAAMGHRDVSVRRRPRVALVATGDELVPLGEPLGPDQIVASNAFGIGAWLSSLGAEVHDLGIAADRLEAIEAMVDRAAAIPADLLVTIGGASVGDHDLVRPALEAHGMALDFWRVAMRPGKPLMFGHLPASDRPGMRVIGLPGNPVSSLVCSLVFVEPLIRALLGQPRREASEAAVIGADIEANESRQAYLRARLDTGGDGLPVATVLPLQDSSALSTFTAADCLLVRPPHAPPARAGEPCRVIRLP